MKTWYDNPFNRFAKMTNQETIDFLVEKYGDRVDIAEPLINTDNKTISTQLRLVEKQIGRTKILGFFWVAVGLAWVLTSTVALATVTDAVKVFNLGLGIIYFVSGLLYLSRNGELKKKKVILDVILFIHNSSYADARPEKP